MNRATATAIALTERGLIPDVLIRASIRKLLRARLQTLEKLDCEANNDLMHTRPMHSIMNCRPLFSHGYWVATKNTAPAIGMQKPEIFSKRKSMPCELALSGLASPTACRY